MCLFCALCGLHVDKMWNALVTAKRLHFVKLELHLENALAFATGSVLTAHLTSVHVVYFQILLTNICVKLIDTSGLFPFLATW